MTRHDSHLKTYLSPREVAAVFKVSPITVRVWAQRGLLPALITPGGHRRFHVADVERLARQRGQFVRVRPERSRVLVVDDDRQLSGFLQELLETRDPPMDVALAHDGFEAGFQLHAFRPQVVLLDLMMPGIDGFEVCRRIKSDSATQPVRVLAMTGFPSRENVERILSVGAERCLTKPLDAEALVALIRAEPS